MHEDRVSAREQLSQRRLHEERERVNELARDLERLLDKASPDLPAEVRNKELKFHLMNALPDKRCHYNLNYCRHKRMPRQSRKPQNYFKSIDVRTRQRRASIK